MPRRLSLAVALLAATLPGLAVSSALAQDTAAPTDQPPAAMAHHKHTHKAHSQTASSKNRLATRLRLGDGKRVWKPTRRQLGVSYAPGGSNASAPGQFHFVVDRKKLRAYLTATARYVRRRPTNAYPTLAEGDASEKHLPYDYHLGRGSGTSTQIGMAKTPVKIVPDVPGAALELDAAVDQVQQAIQNTPATTHILLPVRTTPAKVTAADLQGIDARIGYFVTRFNPGDVGRTMTVRHAIDRIDGQILKPGDVFSVNKNVGERTPANGFFGKGHVFINGHMELQAGGGMCQVATTLFNATMLANLKIVERHQHVRTIPYADPGRDATVYWGAKDFKFANSTDAPLYIEYRTTRNHAICALYGKETPGLKVKLIDHYRRLGERHYTGMFYRVVYNPDGKVAKDPPFYSDYQWPPTLDYSR